MQTTNRRLSLPHSLLRKRRDNLICLPSLPPRIRRSGRAAVERWRQEPSVNMATKAEYATREPQRADVDQLPGPTLLEFGSPTCGHCLAAQPLTASALAGHPGVRHIKVADASGRRLGRSFKVKLWPTLIFLRDGHEVARLVRPGNASTIADALAAIDIIE
jgi:thioredoxin 1